MVIGAVGPAKTNAVRRCVVGNFLCIKAVVNGGSVPKATIGVYGNQADAEAVAAFVVDPSDTSLEAAHDDALAREIHEVVEVPFSILRAMAANARAFVDGGGGGGGAQPVDPLVGASFPVLNFLVVDNTGAYTGSLYTGDIQIVSSINDDTFTGEFDHEGVTYSNAFARRYIGATAHAAAARRHLPVLARRARAYHQFHHGQPPEASPSLACIRRRAHAVVSRHSRGVPTGGYHHAGHRHARRRLQLRRRGLRHGHR